jgi:hypothetical protein
VTGVRDGRRCGVRSTAAVTSSSSLIDSGEWRDCSAAQQRWRQQSTSDDEVCACTSRVIRHTSSRCNVRCDAPQLVDSPSCCCDGSGGALDGISMAAQRVAPPQRRGSDGRVARWFNRSDDQTCTLASSVAANEWQVCSAMGRGGAIESMARRLRTCSSPTLPIDATPDRTTGQPMRQYQ